MERLTEKRGGQNVIPLRQDGKTKWVISSVGMGNAPTQFLYGTHADKLADYEDAEEQGLLVRLPIPTNERIKYIAKMLGVELYEEFKIKTTEYGKLLGTKEIDRVFRFDLELVYKGYNDGWSEWYGFDCDKILYYLLLGKYEIIKEEAEAKLKEMESRNEKT